MKTKIKTVVVGETTTARLFKEDLDKLKSLKRDGESLVLTLNRVLSEATNA